MDINAVDPDTDTDPRSVYRYERRPERYLPLLEHKLSACHAETHMAAQSAQLWGCAAQVCFLRYSPGLLPTYALNTREKWLGEEKPR